MLEIVCGVTQLHDIIYIVCFAHSSVVRFNATTHQRLTDINVMFLSGASEIVACEQTSQLYINYYKRQCIWRVSADGADIKRWWSKSSLDTFKPQTLSVTSTRLLVTSQNTNQLMQLDAVGNELRRVQLPRYIHPYHAVESPTGTFIVSHYNDQLNSFVSEVNTGDGVLRQFSGSRLASLGLPDHVAVDSHGNIFVADRFNCHILLLNAQLKLRRVIVDEHRLNYHEPWRLCYVERTGQLLVGLVKGSRAVGAVAVFNLLRR